MRFVCRLLFVSLALGTGLSMRAQSTTPALSQPMPAQSLGAAGAVATLDLRNYFGLPGVTGQVAQVDTVRGKFNLELFASDAPKTVDNFLAYINAGRWASTIVHRSVSGFIIQAGGYVSTPPYSHIATFAPVVNEFKRSNLRGTVAMAKLGGDPNSATSEWFVNLADNSGGGPALDTQNGGFTVFARVIGSGMSVVDDIAALPVFNAGSPFDTIPLQNVQQGQTSVQPQNLVIVNSVTVVPVYPAGGGAAVLSFSLTNSNPGAVTAAISGSTLTLTSLGNGNASISVTATDTNGNVASGTFSVGVGPIAPTIIAQPQPTLRMASGASGTVVLTVGATGSPAPAYQWRRGGTDIGGATNATLVLTNAVDAQAGSYTCFVSNSAGSKETTAAALSFIPTTDPGRLINLSILTPLAAGETMTMGTAIGGVGTNGSKPLLVRAVGPSLAQLGVSGAMSDPKLDVFSGQTVVSSNDDWGGSASLSAAFASVGAFAYASANSKDAAVFNPSLTVGNYTVQVGGVGTSSGTLIAELYDATATGAFVATTPRLINVSVLKHINTGGTLTAGFYVGGATAKTVLIRAIGPALGVAPFNIPTAMADPQLTLYNSSQAAIAVNNDWGGDQQISQTGTRVGAFAIANGASKDAMLLITLPPGGYTAQVSPAGAGGTAIVEVYEVP